MEQFEKNNQLSFSFL